MDTINITVFTLDNEIVSLSFSGNTLLSDLKKNLESKFETGPNAFLLRKDGKLLSDDSITLRSAGIEEHDLIHMDQATPSGQYSDVQPDSDQVTCSMIPCVNLAIFVSQQSKLNWWNYCDSKCCMDPRES